MSNTFRVICFFRGSQIAQPPMSTVEYEDYIAYLGADNRPRMTRPEMICVSMWVEGVFAQAYVRDVRDIRAKYNDEPIPELDMTEYPNVIERRTA